MAIDLEKVFAWFFGLIWSLIFMLFSFWLIKLLLGALF